MYLFIAAFILSFALTLLTRPHPQNVAASSLSQANVPTAKADGPIPVIWGSKLISSPNVTWYGDLRTERIRVSTGGIFSTHHQTIGHRYYLGMHMVLAAELDAVTEILVKNKTIWSGEALSNQAIDIDKSGLLGGKQKGGGISGTLDVCMGARDQATNDYLAANLPGKASAFRGVTALVLRQMYIGNDLNLEPWAIRGRRIPSWYPSKARIGDDANPAHIIRDLIINNDYGLGYSAADIDEAAFMAAADTLYDEGYGLSLIWSQQESVDDFIGEIVKHIDAAVNVDLRTGLFTINLARGNYDASTLPVLDESNIISLDKFSRQSLDDLTSQISLVYHDADANHSKTVTIQDIALQHKQGVVNATTLQRPGITHADLANKIAQRALKQLSTAIAKTTIIANRHAAGYATGDLFLLTWPPYGIDKLPMRIASIDYGTQADGQIRIQAGEDVFGDADTIYSAPPPSAWQDPIQPPAAAPVRSLREATYHDIITTIAGQPDWDKLPETDGFVLALATKPSGDALDYTLAARTGSADYQTIDSQGFTPSATIAAAIGPADTHIAFATTDDLRGVATAQPQIAYLGPELVRVRNLQADQCDIDRGLLDTVPADHPAGERLWLYDNGNHGTDNHPFTDADSVDVKLLPETTEGQLDAANAPVDSLTINHRAIRPFAPGNVTINASAYPVYITGDLVPAWAHRDRSQQLDTYTLQSDGNQGPEPGTTYTVKIFGETGALIHTETGLTGASYDYPIATEIAESGIGRANESLSVEIHAVRNGYASWQRQRRDIAECRGFGQFFGAYFGQ